MSFVATDPQNHASENTWFTPKDFIEALGPFDLDPCTVSYRPFNTATDHIEHDKGEDSLITSWYGDVWLNPPYGKQIHPFIERFISHRKGMMLIFARMDSEGVQNLLMSGAYVYLLRKRVKFISKEGKKDTNAGTGSCLVFYDYKYIQRCRNFPGILISERAEQSA